MAEPARKLDDDDYDYESESTGYKSPLDQAKERWGSASVIEGDGEDGGDTDEAGIPYKSEDDYFQDLLDSAGSVEAGSEEAQAIADSTGVEPGATHTYTPGDTKKTFAQRVRGKITKKMGLGVASAALVGSAGFFSLSALLPLRTISIMESITDRIFGVTQNTLRERGETLFEHYVKKHVLTKLGPNKCGSTIDRNCMAADITGSNPASRLYRGWKQYGLESKMAEKYGVEFKYNQKTNTIFAVINGNTSELSMDSVNDNNTELRRVLRGRTEVRSYVDDVIEKETKWYNVWKRHELGKFF